MVGRANGLIFMFVFLKKEVKEILHTVHFDNYKRVIIIIIII